MLIMYLKASTLNGVNLIPQIIGMLLMIRVEREERGLLGPRHRQYFKRKSMGSFVFKAAVLVTGFDTMTQPQCLNRVHVMREMEVGSCSNIRFGS